LRFVERCPVFTGSWAVLWEKNESSICSTALNTMHSEHVQFILNGRLLVTIYLQIPRVFCILLDPIFLTFWKRRNYRNSKKRNLSLVGARGEGEINRLSAQDFKGSGNCFAEYSGLNIN
jgi:hypothetical protein